jgi:hypothetical protein
MIAMGHGDFGERAGGVAGVMQPAHRGHAEALRRRGPSPGHVELAVAGGLRLAHRTARTLPAHAPVGASVHRAEDHDRVAASGLQQPDALHDQRLGARAAAHDIDRIIQADAEGGRDMVGTGRIHRLVAGHAVDVAWLQSGVVHGFSDCLASHRQRGPVGRPHVRRFAHADDAVLVSKRSHRFLPLAIRKPRPNSAPAQLAFPAGH